jgi:hypothetical protein
MAWIEAHQALSRHGKTVSLASRLGVPRAQAIGHLMELWWWAMDSCGRDGLLARYSAEAIARGAGWDISYHQGATEDDSFLDFARALYDCGWIDFNGEFPPHDHIPIGGGAKIHDWAQYSGRFFDGEDRKAIVREQTRERVQRHRNAEVERSGNGQCNASNAPTIPNQTIPNQTNKTTLGQIAADFDRFWAAYPNKKSKVVASRVWQKLCPGPDLVEKILASVMLHRSSGQWSKDQGQFIPHPATWLNQQRWEDELKPAVKSSRVSAGAAPIPGKYDHLER